MARKNNYWGRVSPWIRRIRQARASGALAPGQTASPPRVRPSISTCSDEQSSDQLIELLRDPQVAESLSDEATEGLEARRGQLHGCSCFLRSPSSVNELAVQIAGGVVERDRQLPDV